MALGRRLRFGQTVLQERVGPFRVARTEDAADENLGRLVRAPDERRARDIGEAEPRRLAREAIERRRIDEAIDRRVLRRRAEVLPHGHEVDARGAEVGERLEHLVVRLADADHHARLRDPRRVALLHPAQNRERLLVRAAHVADRPLEAAHDLDVVRPHVRLRVDRDVGVREVPAEVAEQRLDEDVGAELLQPGHRARDVGRAAVEEIVAVHHRKDDVLELQLGDRARHVLRLAHVDRAARISRRNGTKAATACAYVAKEHDRGGPLGPALSPIFGQRASSQTVWRSSARRVSFRCVYDSPPGARTLSQAGFGAKRLVPEGGVLTREDVASPGGRSSKRGERGQRRFQRRRGCPPFGDDRPNVPRRSDIESRVPGYDAVRARLGHLLPLREPHVRDLARVTLLDWNLRAPPAQARSTVLHGAAT